jgi:hypothetical protein
VITRLGISDQDPPESAIRMGRNTHMYVAAVEGGVIQGVLPLFLVEGFVTGKVLISTPFAVYGGALAKTLEARSALAEHVRSLAEQLRVEYVELRNSHPEQRVGWEPIQRYVTFTRPVQPEPPKNRWLRSLRKPAT